jgi:hypothetical protein
MNRGRHVLGSLGILMAIGGFLAIQAMRLPEGPVPNAKQAEVAIRTLVILVGVIISVMSRLEVWGGPRVTGQGFLSSHANATATQCLQKAPSVPAGHEQM